MPKVSVIVPVYKVEPYIGRCAESLFSQTLADLEILFIDDCSPDNSVQIIEETLKKYPNRKENVRIIRRESNTGQAGVRLQGIIESRGDFIIHCDGDDWVDADLYELMYRKAIEMGADIVFCDEMLEYGSYTQVMRVDNLPNSCKEVVLNWYSNSVGMFCHNKLVSRQLYDVNSIYPWIGLNMWEDNGLMLRLMYYAGGLSQIRGSYYHYNRSNVSSMTASYGEEQIMQMVEIAQRLSDFFDSKPDANAFQKTKMAVQYYAKIHFITDKWSGLRRFKEVFPGSERIASKLDSNAFSPRSRVRYYLVRYHFAWLFILLYKMYCFLGNKR